MWGKLYVQGRDVAWSTLNLRLTLFTIIDQKLEALKSLNVVHSVGYEYLFLELMILLTV